MSDSSVPTQEENSDVRLIPNEELHQWGCCERPLLKNSDYVLVGHKIRLYPTVRQQKYLTDCVHSARYAYNRALELWQTMYEETGKASAYAVRKQLIAEKAERSPWLLDVSHAVTKNAVATLGDAYDRFFSGQNNYPNFKKRKGEQGSFKADNGPGTFFIVDRGSPGRPGLVIPLPRSVPAERFGSIKMAEPLRWEGEPRSVVISHTPSGQWFASVLMEVHRSVFNTPGRDSQITGGLDLGCVSLGVEADGIKHPNRKPLEFYAKKTARTNRKLGRQKKKSNSRARTRQELGRVGGRVKNIRSDATHKMTTAVVHKYSRLGIETLNTSGMMRNHRVAAQIQDANFGESRRQMLYKARLYDRELVSASIWFPSSNRCSACGVVNESLKSERQWTCSSCGVVHDRDVNSGANLVGVADAVMQVGQVLPELTRVESTAMPRQPDFIETRTHQ